MKNHIYIATGFPGHYPVGTSAVVKTSSLYKAIEMLEDELVDKKLLDIKDRTGRGESPKYKIEIFNERIAILTDGDY